jgi:hypothetical protein
MSMKHAAWGGEDDHESGSVVLVSSAGSVSSFFSEDIASVSTAHTMPLSTNTRSKWDKKEEVLACASPTGIGRWRHWQEASMCVCAVES